MFTVNLDELVRVRFEVSTRPETFVPAGKATLPLTTTSLSSCVETRVPGASTDEMLCSVRTTRVVPAGTIIPNIGATVVQAMLVIMI
ncbi:MAG: hypothetical protein DME45_11865 [Verrucomicrobia bacterium]|nr:MAG: hypothetical protein DME45_11865 [Verrucomicrobiota bacterium]